MKFIVVPKSKQSEIDLDYDRVKESELMTWNLSDIEYEELDRLDTFKQINDLCDTSIDEYEDEHIYADKLNLVLRKYSESENPLILKLMKYIHEAIERNTSIHFYF